MRRVLVLVLSSLCLFTSVGLAVDYPLTTSPDGRYILDGGGEKVFFHGESPWHIFARLTREEATLYLADRNSKGFNALLVSLFVSAGYWTGSDVNAYGEPPFTGADFITPNEEYFAHVDWVMQKANELGFTLFVVPVYMGYQCGDQGWCQEMVAAGPDALREFGEWIGARYASQPNIVWVHGGDVDAGAYPGAMEVLQASVEGILSMDTVHLNTGHCDRPLSAMDCYDLPWLQFNTSYGYCAETPQRIKIDYDRNPPIPFVYIEGRYENEGNFTQRCGRSQAYWALLGGAIGQFYGHGGIWDFPTGWENYLDSPGITSMLNFRGLQLSRPWDLLEPDYEHTSVVAGYGSMGEDYAPAARASDGSTLIVYLPSERTVTIDMGAISGDTAVAWWFDPDAGLAVQVGPYPTTGTRDFTSPSPGEWVLVVDDESQMFEPPGPIDIVPVTLSFRVAWEGRSSILSWNTPEDSGHGRFSVYRGASEEDRMELSGPQEVSRDVSNGLLAYTFIDPSPPREGARYWIAEMTRTGRIDWHGPAHLPPSPDPVGVTLAPASPNPFESGTRFSFATPVTGPVLLTIHDIAGREKARLLDKSLPPGDHVVDWNGVDDLGRALPAGIYLVRLAAGDGVMTQRIIKLH